MVPSLGSEAGLPDPGFDIDLPPHLGLSVGWGVVPTELPGGRWFGDWLCIRGPRALVVSTTGYRVLIEEGSRITVAAPEVWRTLGDPRWLVEGQSVWIAMAQRERLCLHASIVAIGERTVGIAGDSGAGKSTTSTYLASRGHRLVVDDVAPVLRVASQAGTPRVTLLPYRRRVHLTPHAADLLELTFEELIPMAGGGRKASMDPADPGASEVDLDSLFFLVARDDGLDIRQARPRGLVKMDYLHKVAGWNGIAPAIMGADCYLRALAALTNAIPVHIIERPWGQVTLEDVAAIVEQRA